MNMKDCLPRNCTLLHTDPSILSDYSQCTAPQPPLKRRKLVRTRPSSTSQSIPAKVLTTTNFSNKLSTIAIPICSSCHRALNVTHNNNVQHCARWVPTLRSVSLRLPCRLCSTDAYLLHVLCVLVHALLQLPLNHQPRT